MNRILAIIAIVAIVGIIMMAHIAKKKTHPAPAETGQAGGQTQPQPSQPQSLSLEDGLKAHKMIREVVESDLERIKAETQARQAEALAIAKAIRESLEAFKERTEPGPGGRNEVSASPPASPSQIINIHITPGPKIPKIKKTTKYQTPLPTPLPYPRTGGWGYRGKHQPNQPNQIEDDSFPVPVPEIPETHDGSASEPGRHKRSRRRIGREVARIGLDFAQQFAYGWALSGKPGRSAGAAAINTGIAAARRQAGL